MPASHFISEITGRSESKFMEDLQAHQKHLENETAGKRVLVIGGGGTIGSAFIKALLHVATPKTLVVIDQNENALTELTRDLRSTHNLNVPDDYRPYPIDFGSDPFHRLLATEPGFDIVAHFAAHKHVRSERDMISMTAMLHNNVFKTHRLLEALGHKPPRHFFSVSTDKATDPANLMGASKLLMERLLWGYTDRFKVNTARFANVLFSNGSLPAAFLERLAKKQPLSAPSNIKRYFISPEEAGQLCLLACLAASNGETLFPKFNPDYDLLSFVYIAKIILENQGLDFDLCRTEEEARAKAAAWQPGNPYYPVYFFESNTDGEKMSEEFFSLSEKVYHHVFKQIGVIAAQPQHPDAKEAFESRLLELARDLQDWKHDKNALTLAIRQLIPEYRPLDKGSHLDQRM